MIIFASDLDNTLIYSYRRMEDGVCVELYEGRPCSYMTGEAHRLLQEAASQVMFVPVTTRSLLQYRRISFPQAAVPPYALAGNGGILLRNGEEDPDWAGETKRLIHPAGPVLERALSLLADDPHVFLGPRLVDGIFVFAKTADMESTVAALNASLDAEHVYVDFVGEKVYVFPLVLDKGLALRRLRQLLGPVFIISAGDSSFDIPMLLEADAALVPGEEVMLRDLHPLRHCRVVDGERTRFGDRALEFVIKTAAIKAPLTYTQTAGQGD